jgi:hypothetical protein
MKRIHIHLAVPNVAEAIPFYSTLFATKPSVIKSDYAKWMLDDPRVNFAISARGKTHGLDHLGIQAESPGELAEIYGRLQAANRPMLEQGETTCCYAQSTKSWIGDPAGIAWEAFLTTGESTFYGDSSDTAEAVRIASKPEAGACCGRQVKEDAI